MHVTVLRHYIMLDMISMLDSIVKPRNINLMLFFADRSAEE